RLLFFSFLFFFLLFNIFSPSPFLFGLYERFDFLDVYERPMMIDCAGSVVDPV
ncbi:hypothetical protein BDV23DRAFT_146943, partial [Aspergillus alliaceus]